jgi:hypothetical protein
MIENDSESRKSGRYRLNEEDKARPVPLKLHQTYIDRINHLPGKNTAETIRNLIDNSIEWSERERRQVKEIQRLIAPLYRVAKSLVDPDVKSDKSLYLNNLQRFRSGVSSLEALLEVLHFDISSLKKLLSDRDMVMLEIIFSVRSTVNTQ